MRTHMCLLLTSSTGNRRRRHAFAFHQRELAVGGGFLPVDAQLALEVIADAFAVAQGTGKFVQTEILFLPTGLTSNML